MAHLVVRKTLRNLGLLDSVKAIKARFYHRENAFRPATPHTLISTNACLTWLKERDLLSGTDYLEFGIFRGFNLWYAQALIKSWGIEDVRFFGFDSFFGLPEINGLDADGPFHEGQFYASRAEVEHFLTRSGTDWDRTTLVEGFFSDTLRESPQKRHGERKFSLCVVDCDLYTSTKEVLDYIALLISDPSIIWFDDWNDYSGDPELGERKAFTEFCEKHSDWSAEPLEVPGGNGCGFIMSRK